MDGCDKCSRGDEHQGHGRPSGLKFNEVIVGASHHMKVKEYVLGNMTGEDITGLIQLQGAWS